MTSPTPDVAATVAELRKGARANGVGPRVANLVAYLLEHLEAERQNQAKALSDTNARHFDADDRRCYWQNKAEAAEASLAEFKAEAMKVIEPFAKAGELFGPRNDDEYDQCIYGPAAGPQYNLMADHLRTARSFLNAQEKA